MVRFQPKRARRAGALAGVAVALCGARVALRAGVAVAAPERVPVVFAGGHETDGRDRGRPVILIASALGVPEAVFRDAFSRVRPAPAGTRPTREREEQNKRVLLEALAPYGITNERLDEVSNHYRYRREAGELWPTREAVAYAEVAGGTVRKIVVTDGGEGYSSPPQASIPGAAGLAAKLSFSKKFEANGAVIAIEAAPKQ